MELGNTLLLLFPNANPMLGDYIVQDDVDGNGPYIAQWNLPDKQPSEAELLAAWEAWQPPAPKGELPPVDDIDSMGLEEVKGVLKALVERAS